MIKQHGDHQRQRFMAAIKMLLHGREGIAQESERHMAVRGALMLNDDIDIALSLAGMQRVENIGIAGAQVVLNKAPGFQVQSA